MQEKEEKIASLVQKLEEKKMEVNKLNSYQLWRELKDPNDSENFL